MLFSHDELADLLGKVACSLGMRLLAPSRIKEVLDLRPILSGDVIRADVPATVERLESDSGEFRKSLASLIRHMRIVFGVEQHHFRRRDFGSMVPRIVESPASQLFPVRIRKAIPVPERLADIFGIILSRGFDLFGTI